MRARVALSLDDVHASFSGPAKSPLGTANSHLRGVEVPAPHRLAIFRLAPSWQCASRKRASRGRAGERHGSIALPMRVISRALPLALAVSLAGAPASADVPPAPARTTVPQGPLAWRLFGGWPGLFRLGAFGASGFTSTIGIAYLVAAVHDANIAASIGARYRKLGGNGACLHASGPSSLDCAWLTRLWSERDRELTTAVSLGVSSGRRRSPR